MNNNSKRLFKYILKQKKKILLGVLATLLMSIIELLTGSMLKFLTDLIDSFSGSFVEKITNSVSLPVKYTIKFPLLNEKITILNTKLKGSEDIFKGMVILCFVFVGLYLLLAIFNYLRRVLMNAATQRILQNFKTDIYNKILKLPYSFFTSNKTGDVVSRITYDVNTLSEIIDLLIEVARTFVYVLVFIPVMLFMSWQLALVTILFFPISIIFIDFITRKIKKVSKKLTDNVGDYTAFLEEKINRIKLVKAYGKEGVEGKAFSCLVEKNYQYNLKLIKLKFSMNPTNEFVGIVLLAGIYIFYSYKLTHDSTSLGDIVFFLFLVKTLYKPIKKVAQAWGQLHIALVSTSKIFKLIDEPEEQQTSFDEYEKLEIIETIEFEHVAFSYQNNERIVLQDINLKAKRGDVIAILGKTGAGKSTLLSLLPCIYMPLSGNLKINAFTIQEYDLSEIRKKIKYVDSTEQYLNGSIYENIIYGGTEPSENNKLHFAYFLGLKNVDGLNQLIGKDGMDLSEGQKQKLSFLRAILSQPQVLILDEVFSSLDKEDIRFMFELAKTIPIVIIVCRKPEVLDYTTKQYILSNGKIELVN